MASKKRRKKPVRTVESYLSSARKNAALVPSLKKFKKRKTLKKSEKATIRRREKQLQNVPFLQPITSKQAKILGRRKVFLPGIQAIQLRNVDTSKGDTFKISKHGDVEINTAEGKWIYWSIDRDAVRSRVSMRDAGRAAFEKKLPIEKVSDLTAKAFEQYNVQEVRLWAHAGIVGDGFLTLEEFIMWVNEKWNQGRYISTRIGRTGEIYENPSDPGKWVNGIAILIENPEYTKRRKTLDAKAKTN